MKPLAIAVGVVVIVVVLFVGFMFIQFMGMGGWEPDKNSSYAVRMRAMDARLRLGMTRQQVKAIFHADIASNHRDTAEDSSNAFEGAGNPVWSSETDLTAFEPRRHFWNSFDTAWTVRAGFDKNDKLIRHRLQVDEAGGP